MATACRSYSIAARDDNYEKGSLHCIESKENESKKLKVFLIKMMFKKKEVYKIVFFALIFLCMSLLY